jgi:uncharacterized protein (DUF427 family)
MSATSQPAMRGPVRIETGHKRVRAYLGGEVVVDTTAPLLVWERPYYPTYYFPLTDVRAELLPAADGAAVRFPGRRDDRRLSVRAGGVVAEGAAVRGAASPLAELRDAIRLEWDAMDAWFEEDEEVFTHARDPYTRVDILPSSRHVRVEVGGLAVAESTSPRLLFETGLPVRHYLPKLHVRMDLLTPSDLETHCPYKGRAEYWSVGTAGSLQRDLAWSYAMPLPESQKIAGLVCFYEERVDLYVDGALQARPLSRFARGL